MKSIKSTVLVVLILINFHVQSQMNPWRSNNLVIREFFSTISHPSPGKDFFFDLVGHMSDTSFFTKTNPDTIEADIWSKLYEEMYYSAFDTTNWVSPEEVYDRGQQFYSDTIPIQMFAFDYYKLIDSALTTLTYFDFDTVNDLITDKSPRIGYPFLDSAIFAASPTLLSAKFANVTYRIDPDLVFHDQYNPYFNGQTTVRIDFGDGTGWNTINPSQIQHFSVLYPTSGWFTVSVEVFGNPSASAPTHSARSAIFIVDSMPSKPPDSSFVLPGIRGGVFFGCSTGGLQDGKIVIYLEGWDMGDAVHSQNRGVNEIYTKMIELDPVVDLRNFGYSFIVVDWKNSRTDIKFNAFYLMNLLETLKCGNDQQQQFVIMGESMGGLVARFALTYMESSNYVSQDLSPFLTEDGDPDNDSEIGNVTTAMGDLQYCISDKKHNTRLLITLDTPHKGANVPLSLQWAYVDQDNVLKMLGQVAGGNLNGNIKLVSHALSSQAAQQMLIYYYSALGSGSVNHAHEDKDQFFDELSQLGNYPVYCKTVALSQGSISGESQMDPFSSSYSNRTPNDYLLDFSFDAYSWILGFKIKYVGASLEARTNSNYVSNTLYNAAWGWFSIGIQVKWIGINITTGYSPIYSRSKGGYTMPTCTSPGGSIGGQYNSTLNTFSQSGSFMSYNWITNLFQSRTTYDGDGCIDNSSHIGLRGYWSHHFDFSFCTDGLGFCFVPTLSALDYGSSLEDLNLDHDILNDGSIYTSMNTDVITGIHPSDANSDNSYNRPHTGESKIYGPFKNDQIYDLTFSGDPFYYSCKTHSSPGIDRPRGFLNLEIGDEEMFLENYILGIDAIYQAEYDINVNIRNPYYNYPGGISGSYPIHGVYSKMDDFDIETSAHATFKVDKNNSPNNPNGGLTYIPAPAGQNGPYTIDETPLYICCDEYPNSQTARKARPEMASKIKVSNNFLDIFPNPGDGKTLNIRLKMEKSSNANVRIYNSMGQLLSENLISLGDGVTTIQFNRFGNLMISGLYTMKIYGNDELLEKKFIIQ